MTSFYGLVLHFEANSFLALLILENETTEELWSTLHHRVSLVQREGEREGVLPSGRAVVGSSAVNSNGR